MAELPRPGVEVIQQFQAAAPTILNPTLVPFVTGPAKEIVNFVNTDGSINTNDKQGSYEQLPQVIAQSAFPSPRGNISEVVVDESSIQSAILFGGRLSKLDKNPGSAFLLAWNNSARAAYRTPEITGSGLALDGLTLVLAIDQTVRLNTTQDIAVTFHTVGGGNLTAQQIADQINAAVGETVATLIPVSSNNRVQVCSTQWGAGSSVTVRAGGSANSLLVNLTNSNEYRVEAAGFYAQDQSDNTTLSPYIAWSRGNELIAGVVSSFTTAGSSTASFGQVHADVNGNDVYAEAQQANLTFTGGGSIQLKVGDYFVADGSRPNSTAEISRVETNRFKLGTINSTLSTFDAEGNLLTAVYDDSKVNTLLSATPFAPHYAWFKARNLTGVNDLALPATMTGTELGVPATVGTVLGVGASGPFSLAGLTLVTQVTLNGVVQATNTFTFTGGPFADIPAVVTAIGSSIPNVAATTVGGQLALSTTSTGDDQAITLLASSTAAATLGFTGLPTTGTGTDVEIEASAAVLTGTASQTFPFTATAGQTLVVKLSTDGGATYPTTRTYTWPVAVGPFADISALVTALQLNTSWDGSTTPTQFTIGHTSDKLTITDATTGDLAWVKIDATSTGIGGATNASLQFTSGQADGGEDDITGLTFKLRLDDRPDTYSVTFQTNSLDDAVADINHVVGFTVASIGGGSSSQLVLTSPLDGMASSIEIVDDGTNNHAFLSFGFTSEQTASGSGRPNPDFMLDISGNALIGAEILRNSVTGQPFGNSIADLYIQYTGLRLDVSPRATHPALLSISDVTTLQQVLGPLDQSNPLGLAMFFQIINAPGIASKGLGVSAVSAGEPEGTLAAYTEVASFIQSEEVYAICPLTSAEVVHEMFEAHVNFMSSAAQKGERILITCPLDPLRAVDNVLASGLAASSTATANQLIGDVNPSQALTDNGINPALTIPQDKDVYVQIVVDGVTRRYNVSGVNGVLFTFRTTFTGGFNADGFYTTTQLTESLVDEVWSMKIRGAALLIPGSSLLDKDKVAATVAARSAAIKNRRVISVFPQTIVATVDGSDQLISSYYYGAGMTGMTAAQPPQQGFTNLPATGYTGVKGSNDTFSTQQLNIMAGGGTWVIIQDVAGGPVISRHQLTTDLTSIETREYSITKIVDFVAKFMRTGLRNYIGTFNITQPFLDMLSTVIQGQLAFLEEGGVILGGDLNNLIQDKNNPDTVLVDITLDVPFPCNYIRLTLVI